MSAAFIASIFMFFFLSFVPCGVWSAPPVPLRVEAIPIKLDPEDPGRTQFGGLAFLSGFELSSEDYHFRGLSGLELSADSNSLYAVSDYGYWFSARLRHDVQGRLTGLGPWEMGPLLTPEGGIAEGRLRDAEALVRDQDGSLIVAFEQNHRLWRYPPAVNPFAFRPKVLPVPPELLKAPGNGGLEAVTVLPDSRLLLLTEDYKNPDGSLKGWLIEKDRFFTLSYLDSDGFRPTDLATLANGDVLLLERRYDWLVWMHTRIRRLSRSRLKPGARLQGELVAELGPPLSVDNFEGLAVRQDPKAGTFLYVISDDNYIPLQRTLLLQFRFIPPSP
ncbi:MAG: esterase-like activity of phytase family protein [Candidatus Binatia bacterium]